MLTKCKTCNSKIEQIEEPAYNNPNGGESWLCDECGLVICVNCYHKHQLFHIERKNKKSI